MNVSVLKSRAFRSAAYAVVFASLLPVSTFAAPPTSPSTTKGKTTMSTNPRVALHTNQGDIVITLDAEKAPKIS